jgi:hypothetical protein
VLEVTESPDSDPPSRFDVVDWVVEPRNRGRCKSLGVLR